MQYNYQQYKEQSINTMTKGEMLILLYNEIIKRLTKAKILLYNEDYEPFVDEINRSHEIINYLIQTLDLKFPVSADLLKMYDFISYELSRAKAARKSEIIDEVLPFVTELRDTWKEADKLSKGMVANGH